MSNMNDMREDSPAARLGSRIDRGAETSTIANSKAEETMPAEKQRWYRDVRMLKWIWLGVDPWLIQEVMARIAASDAPRTHDKLLDTVKGYRPGNWIYEWTQEAAQALQLAKLEESRKNNDTARQHFLEAAVYYAIASFPHLRGDFLAEEAMTQGIVAYRQAGKYFPVPLKTIEVPYQGKKISCGLHLPNTDEPCPVVIVTGGSDALQTDFYRLFETKFSPAGLAMLTVDMPGAGMNDNWNIKEDMTTLHQAVLAHLPEVAWVDHNRVAMLGIRLGGNIATRLAFVAPKSLKAAVNIGGPVHQPFIDPHLRQHISQMLLDQIASRLGMDSAVTDPLLAKLHNFSLVRQGLVGTSRTSVPILAVGHPDDDFCTKSDLERVTQSSKQGELVWLKERSLFNGLEKGFDKAISWLQDRLS